VVSDLLRHFQLTAVLQIGGNTGRAEGMVADARFDAGGLRAPADDSVGVLLEEGIGGQLAGLAAGGAEEIAVDVISKVRIHPVETLNLHHKAVGLLPQYPLP
jgi:hypothetical protein